MDDTTDLENKSVVNFREEPFRHRRDKPNSLGEKKKKRGNKLLLQNIQHNSM